MLPRNQPPGEFSPKLARKVDPNEVSIKVEERPRKVLALATILNCSIWVKGAKYMVPSITEDMNIMISDAKSISNMDAARSHSASPGCPAVTLCLIMLTLRVRRTVVLPAKKLVIITSRRVATFTSILGCSTDHIPA